MQTDIYHNIKEVADHNFFKAYIGMMMVKAVMDETKSLDQQKFRDKIPNSMFCVKNHPGILMDLHYDENGYLDRQAFIVKVVENKHNAVDVLPPLYPEWFTHCQ